MGVELDKTGIKDVHEAKQKYSTILDIYTRDKEQKKNISDQLNDPRQGMY